jgi:hypothetical protein
MAGRDRSDLKRPWLRQESISFVSADEMREARKVQMHAADQETVGSGHIEDPVWSKN